MHGPLDLVRDEIRRSFRGPAWHGPSLFEALGDLTAAEASARPIGAAHSIAELLLHCLAWTEEVTRRVDGGEAAQPERGDWPAVAPLDARRWQALQTELAAAAARLDERLGELSPERLVQRVAGAAHDPPLGSGVRFDVMLHGLAQHNAYHGGQIALLRKLLRTPDGS